MRKIRKAPKPKVREVLSRSVVDSVKMATESRPVQGRPRQIVLGAMIGVALSFLIGLMEVSHLDTALNVAALAVGAALPLLVIALVIASTQLPPGQHTVFANVLNLAGWLVGEGLGSLCILTGFVAMLWHLNEAAVWVSLGAVALAVLLMLIVFLGVTWKIASVDEKAKKAGESPEEARRRDRFISGLMEEDNSPEDSGAEV